MASGTGIGLSVIRIRHLDGAEVHFACCALRAGVLRRSGKQGRNAFRMERTFYLWARFNTIKRFQGAQCRLSQ